MKKPSDSKGSQKCKLIMGANGKMLYGLCSRYFVQKMRWKIQDGEQAYSEMVKAYENEVDPAKKAKQLQDLTYLAEFNEMECRNMFSPEFQDVDKKAVFNRYNANERDCMNTLTCQLPPDDKLSYASPEDAIITLIDLKRLAEEE